MKKHRIVVLTACAAVSYTHLDVYKRQILCFVVTMMFHRKRTGLHALCFFPDEVSLLILGNNLLRHGAFFIYGK